MTTTYELLLETNILRLQKAPSTDNFRDSTKQLLGIYGFASNVANSRGSRQRKLRSELSESGGPGRPPPQILAEQLTLFKPCVQIMSTILLLVVLDPWIFKPSYGTECAWVLTVHYNLRQSY